MKRTLIAVLVSVAMASAASAASLSATMTTGTLYAAPGAAVSVDISTTITNPEATVSLGLDVRLIGNGGITWGGAVQTGLTSFGGGLPWTQFPPICSGADPCVAVNQANPVLPAGAQPDSFSGVIATATGIAGPAGTYNLDIVVVDYFGVASATQTSYTVVPEPATAGLLSLGLLGLAFAGRRR